MPSTPAAINVLKPNAVYFPAKVKIRLLRWRMLSVKTIGDKIDLVKNGIAEIQIFDCTFVNKLCKNEMQRKTPEYLLRLNGLYIEHLPKIFQLKNLFRLLTPEVLLSQVSKWLKIQLDITGPEKRSMIN